MSIAPEPSRWTDGTARPAPGARRPIRETPLRVVPGRLEGSRPSPFAAALVLLVGAGLVGLLLLNTAMQQRAFALTALDAQADDLDIRAAALAMRAERPASPQRLAVAADQLGMVPSRSVVFLRLSDGRVVGKPVPASPASQVPGLLPSRATVSEPARRPPDSVVPDAPTTSSKPPRAAESGQDGGRIR